MALLESCCGCGLAISSAVLGVYLLVAYIIAFTIELWWILESPVTLPIPAYLLCLGYFILFTFSALLLHGLSVKRTTFLLIWLFMMGILLGPEAGLVLYLSIHYWRVTSLYGLIEVTCWGCRLLVNAVGLLCVQSLHSIWREEKSVMLRLETLKAQQNPVPKLHQSGRGRRLSVPSVVQGFNNHGYESDVKSQKEKADIDYCRFDYTSVQNEDCDGSYIDPYFNDSNQLSEFNASSFDPTVIDSRLEKMPYLTISQKPKELNVGHGDLETKTRSMIDLRDSDFNNLEIYSQKKLVNPINFLDIKNKFPKDNFGSLDRNIIKNKNLKILKTLSPFYKKKPIDEMNIYRINPPSEDKMAEGMSNLDFQLNRVYGNRGMYMFDEKARKVVFYPPEYFTKTGSFRKRMDSYASTQSRSSVDTDSEDLRHISDVAL